VLRLSKKPLSITLNGQQLKKTKETGLEGYTWQPLQNGGILTHIAAFLPLTVKFLFFKTFFQSIFRSGVRSKIV